ncbi:uncharacterized protein LOC144166301 [Haemaphysalis longicornis]
MQPSSLAWMLGSACVAAVCSDSASCHGRPGRAPFGLAVPFGWTALCVSVDNTGDVAVSETPRFAPAFNAVLQMSALLALLWLVLIRAVPPLSLLSPWLFNGMILTTARSSPQDHGTLQNLRWSNHVMERSGSPRCI